MANRLPDIRGVTNDQSDKGNRLNFNNIDHTLREIVSKINKTNKESKAASDAVAEDASSLFVPVNMIKTSDLSVTITPAVISDWNFNTLNSSVLFDYLSEVDANSGKLVVKKKCTLMSTVTFDMFSILAGTAVFYDSILGQKKVVQSTAQTSASTDSVATASITSVFQLNVGNSLYYSAQKLYGSNIVLSKENYSTWELMRIK